MKYVFGLLFTLTTITTLMSQLTQNQLMGPALITTTGEATIYVEPDEVHFTININNEGEDLLDAKRMNAEMTNEAVSYLKSQGVEAKHIQTQYLNVSVQYRDREKRQPRFYANQSINVCLKEVAQFEQINIGLLQLGVTGINGPRFKSTKDAKLRAEAKTKAIVDAKNKAQQMSAALGQNIGNAYRIDATSGNRSNTPVVYARAMAMDSEMGSAGPGIATGELQIKETVTISFYLKD